MKPFTIRYYTDWTRTGIATRSILAYDMEDVLAALPHMHPFTRNPALMIDITEGYAHGIERWIRAKEVE